jgi:hypothetical protein
MTYSNWEWATRCQSESLLSLRHGFQESLHRLGAAPDRVQIDNSSAATHRVGSGGREFNPDFLSLVSHYGMKAQTIGIDCPDQKGDVESQNGHLKLGESVDVPTAFYSPSPHSRKYVVAVQAFPGELDIENNVTIWPQPPPWLT